MRLSDFPSRFLRNPFCKVCAIVSAVLCVIALSAGIYAYNRYSRLIELKLDGHLFQDTARIYDGAGNLVTSVSGQAREKRRVVEFQDIPKLLINAVTAGEDQKFFAHHGLDPKRIAGAFIWNLDRKHRLQGGSTITQQLARNLFLTREPTLRRKVSEASIAVLLELRLTKEQIFTMYSNEVYLGERGSYAIRGFGEAASAFFGKDLSELTLAETATLAGIIPAPNAFSPGKHPERALARRDLILKAMRQSGSITEDNYQAAKQTKLEVIQDTTDMTEAPYFIDFTRDELLKRYSDDELLNGGLNVYTTLDLDFQKAAVEAVSHGLALVQEEIAKRDKKNKTADSGGPPPQAGLIALDPHTGEVKAMVGGTDYTSSQYNRITQAFRQPGSVFKPFVYTAALETAYDVDVSSLANLTPVAEASEESDVIQSIRDRLITSITTIVDEPRTFVFGGVTYEPNNFKKSYSGAVTLRTALQRSLNSAAIQVAEKIGYDRVARLAQRMGLNSKIKGYPSVALGAFEVTPIELAGAYTAFANEGKRVEPHAIRRVEAAAGWEMKTYDYTPRSVLNPQIAYLMTHLMEGVINSGTGAGVRARGFKLPAAGKTGTSRDGWFAGYTKDLLVIAWVGYDDNRDLNLEGSRSALPIWTEFMQKAYAIHPPQGRMSFNVPGGIEFVRIDAESLARATPDCTNTFEEAFIAGTAPAAYCTLHSPEFAIGVDAPPSQGVASPDISRAKPSPVN